MPTLIETPSLRAAVGAPSPYQRLTVDDVTLAYSERGAGPAVVCLHAIGHGAGDFTRLAARLADRHRVIALDWPGHGRSGPDRVPTSAERYADVLAGFVDRLGIEQATVIGNSIGGAAAIRWAAAHPGRARGLVLENPGGLDPAADRLARTVTAAMIRFFAAGRRQAWWFPWAFGAYYRTCVLGRTAGEQRTRIVRAGSEVAPLLHDAWRSFATTTADIRELAAGLACPVLFVWAKGDRFIQLGRSLPAIRRMANARVETVAGRHAAHLEAPETFERLVQEFLADQPAAVPTRSA